MPITAAPIKVEAVKRLGGIIELVGETYAEAQTHAQVSDLVLDYLQSHTACTPATACNSCAEYLLWP